MSWFTISIAASIIILIVVAIGALLWFYFRQELMIFHPEKLPQEYRFQFDYPFEERFYEPKNGVRLHALHFKVKDPKGVVLYFHGNAGSNASWGLHYKSFIDRGYDFLLFDYRGYGKSSGKIIRQPTLLKDATFIAKEVRKLYRNKRIVYYGRSLGSGIATFVAKKIPPQVLVLATPYFNFIDVVKHHYPFIPVKLILKYTLRTDRWIRRIDCPTYLVHGTQDNLVPFESSIRLEKQSQYAKLISIQGANHSNYVEHTVYAALLDKILV